MGIGYVLLGGFAVISPAFAARLFNIHPTPLSAGDEATVKEAPYAIRAAKNAHAVSISVSMLLLGARDVSIGSALIAFHYQGDSKAMGTLITCGMILCMADVFWIWKLRGWQWGSAFAAGAGSWGAVGLGLLRYV